MGKTLLTAAGLVALTVASGACNRETVERQDTAAESQIAKQNDAASELQKQRDADLSKLDDRVAALDRKYEEWAAKPRGTSGRNVTPNLSSETTSEMDDVRKAVSDLRTTTPENWWERYEAAFKTGIGDVEHDVRKMAGARTLPATPKARTTTDPTGTPVSTAPFMSSRDTFVNDMRARIESMNKALGNVKASGPRKTELDDLKARVKKLDDDVDRLGRASAEDWWDLSKTRVNEYIDRVEASVGRLDNHG